MKKAHLSLRVVEIGRNRDYCVLHLATDFVLRKNLKKWFLFMKLREIMTFMYFRMYDDICSGQIIFDSPVANSSEGVTRMATSPFLVDKI